MEIKHGKHVKIICDLQPGDMVYTEGWGYQLDGKKLLVEDIRHTSNCESGFLVKVDKYENYIDSNWLHKKEVPQLKMF